MRGGVRVHSPCHWAVVSEPLRKPCSKLNSFPLTNLTGSPRNSAKGQTQRQLLLLLPSRNDFGCLFVFGFVCCFGVSFCFTYFHLK